MLLFWVCTLNTFQPACARDRRALVRNLCQCRKVEHFLNVWKEPQGMFRLISHVMERPLMPTRPHTQSQRQDHQVRRSLRLAALGRYKDVVVELSQSPPAEPSATTCAQLESLHPSADSIPAVPPRTPSTIARVPSAHILRAISSFPRGSLGGVTACDPRSSKTSSKALQRRCVTARSMHLLTL